MSEQILLRLSRRSLPLAECKVLLEVGVGNCCRGGWLGGCNGLLRAAVIVSMAEVSFPMFAPKVFPILVSLYGQWTTPLCSSGSRMTMRAIRSPRCSDVRVRQGIEWSQTLFLLRC